MSPNLFTTWRPGQQSLLARFGRCTRLSLELLANGDELSDEDEGEENQQPQPLLAALCFSGLEPAAAAGITHLRLTSSELQLRALAGHAIAVAGWLRNVRELELNSAIPYEDGPADNRAVYIALRAALPRLEALVLPSHVRSLQQLTQISRLDISDLSGSISIECDVGQAAEAAALPGCEDDQATMAGLCFALVQCDAPWRLVAALTAAGALVPGRLEASALLSWPFQCAWGVYIKETLESPSWYTGVLAAGADGAGAGPGAGGDTLAAAGGSVGMSGAQQQGTGEGKLEPAGDQVKLDDEELIAQLHRLVLMSGQALSKVLWAGDN
eukprot:XP_001694392.1 predicted protein [Chlamydomonas reinhardtii]